MAAHDESSVLSTKSNIRITAVPSSKENQIEIQEVTKDAFLRPAQRPQSAKGTSILPAAANGYIQPLTGSSHLPLQSLNKPSKRATTMIYNDSRPSTSGSSEVIEVLYGREQPASTAAQVVRKPRHHQSQPALSATRRALEIEKSIQEHLPLYDAAIAANWETIAAEDDDATSEAPYLDAVEEFPLEKFPALESNRAPSPALPDDVIMPETKTSAKVVDFQPDLLPGLPADDPLEVSDYEDAEYYDDQGYSTAHSYRSRGDTTTGVTTTLMFPPKLTKKGIAELAAAKETVENNRTEEEMDEEAWDISMVAEYGDEIFQYMRELEMALLPNPHYMDIQTEIQWSMRGVLMDWVIQVHGRFHLLPETLFLIINYIDRFLSVKVVSLGKLQLVGATAIFVAAKYEEINCPSVQEIVYMVDGGYSVDEILKAERFMLSMLNFELGWPGPMSFLRRISKADDYDLETRTLAKYFLEVTVMDERFVASPPSYLAAGAHCLSRLILDKGEWSVDHVHYSGYTYSQLKPLIALVLDCCRNARKHHVAVFKKYSDKRFKSCALYVEIELEKGYCLPFQPMLPSTSDFERYDSTFTRGDNCIPSHASALKMPIPLQG
ncbi:cyclin-like protein [Xylariales sp. PMI_506]|nr:cyclin-like protein [Xylariales sp. PMI_506]